MLFKTSQYFKAFSVFPSLLGNFCEFCEFMKELRDEVQDRVDRGIAAKNGAKAGGEYLNTKGRRS